MDVYEAMAGRMTIRDFSSKEISPELIQKIIGAGFKAPTNNHMREWHFVLMQDRPKRQELIDQVIHPIGKKGAIGVVNRWGMTDEIQRDMYIDAIPKQYNMLLNAGCLVLPFFHQPKPLLKPKDLSALNAFASIWCCVENILVAAAAEGIYGVTRIPFEEERKTIKALCNIPEEYETPCWIALGYPAENVVRARQVEICLDDRIHLDRWN
jgi:nitroreductase